MAVITPTLVSDKVFLKVYKWEALTDGDTGAPIELPSYWAHAVQVMGTFGSGGSIKMQGYIDEATPTYADLNDNFGVAFSLAAAGIKIVTTPCIGIRPYVVSGDGTTDLDVYIMFLIP